MRNAFKGLDLLKGKQNQQGSSPFSLVTGMHFSHEESMAAKPSTIFLIEDNPSDIALTRRAFEKSRIANTLVIAEDGQEALDYLFAEGSHAGRDAADLPALVLLDLKLPKVSGLDVLRRIRADPRTSRLPVVILTTSKQERDVTEGYERGVNSYISKPVDFKQFAEAMDQLGFYWLILNEPPPKPKKPRQVLSN